MGADFVGWLVGVVSADLLSFAVSAGICEREDAVVYKQYTRWSVSGGFGVYDVQVRDGPTRFLSPSNPASP